MAFPYLETIPSGARDGAPRIDAVLFDYGQVLSLPPEPSAWARILAITGLDDKRLHDAYWEFRHDYDRAALTGRDYWQAVAGRTVITLNDTQIDQLFAADVDLWTNLNLPMVAWARRLQRAGIRTGILSNIGDAIAEGIIAKLPWLADFDHCTWSYALATAKPDPVIYLRSAEALRTAPAHILFIDDRADNIAAANALGFQTIHFTTYPAFERQMRDRDFGCLLDVGVSADPKPEAEPATTEK